MPGLEKSQEITDVNLPSEAPEAAENIGIESRPSPENEQLEGGDHALETEAKVGTERGLLDKNAAGARKLAPPRAAAASSFAQKVPRAKLQGAVARTMAISQATRATTRVLASDKLADPEGGRAPAESVGKGLQRQATLMAKVPGFQNFQDLKALGGESFSCNFLSEISIENLQKEYYKSVDEAYEYRYDPFSPPQYCQYME